MPETTPAGGVDAVIFDWGGTLEGYKSDITRTVVIGEPTDEFRKVYEIVSRGCVSGASTELVLRGKIGAPSEDLLVYRRKAS